MAHAIHVGCYVLSFIFSLPQKFPETLRKMIMAGHLEFGSNNEDIRIVDPDSFYNNVIKQYNKGETKTAFKRQLSFYGFYKVRKVRKTIFV